MLAAAATAAALAGTALAATAPPAPAVPIGEGGGSAAATSAIEPERVKFVGVQVDEGYDWGDTGIGAAGMLTLVLIGYGGAHALTTIARHRRSPTHS